MCLCIFIRLLPIPHPDHNPMFHQLPFQGDHAIGHALAVHFHPGDTALTAKRIFHLDVIDRLPMPVAEAEARPRRGDDRIHPHLFAPHL